MQKSDFRDSATKLKASRDVGAQFFCALLRLAGVDARLVCSLQPLPFAANTKGTAPQLKPMPAIADPESMTATSENESAVDTGSDTSIRTTISTRASGAAAQIRSRLATRLGRPPPIVEHAPSSVPPPPKSKLCYGNIRYKR